ncbi:thiol:disulfide interchange protein DsbA/DsbL [Shewanella abyssi]|uniref:thiol:disulfide interchange protein DsbA/DsbL n=1 Tax=Shewanella abyssi TaxID=311789 RepID=UPI00200E8AD9|nr:thiol:disulfide interchange protein DsbA/DsbL [Shewanella abyssi]MCL1050999.1 thiol:disulfide interchange protein DsbA/DsbL [Shewanella abyssi]
MLNKGLFLLLVLLTLSICNISHAIEFTEGDYYVEVEGKPTATKQVTEYFSFYCPACFNQESLMSEIKAFLPADAQFKKNHVDGMPGRDLEIERSLTKALITAGSLQVSDKVIAAIFNYIHVDKASFSDNTAIKDLFLANGVDGEAFDKVFSSFSVNTQARQMQRNTERLRQQGYTGVPTLIINGKYKPIAKKIRNIEEYQALITYLLNKPL